MASLPKAEPTAPTGPRFPIRLRPVAMLVSASLIVAATYAFTRLGPMPHPGAASAPPVTIAAPDGPTGVSDDSQAQMEEAIGVWSANLKRDSEDFISATNLAEDYYSRARLTGNLDDYTRAAEALRMAIHAYPQGTVALLLRAQLLFATHDFAGSLSAAQALLKAHPDQLAPLATIGDAQLELGQYSAAGASFARLATEAPGAAVTARLAHLAALRGNVDSAQQLAARAISEQRSADPTPLNRSWYEYLAGYIAFQFGDLGTAQRQYTAAIEDWPGSYLAIAGLAHTRAAQGATAEAIGLYQRAIAIVPQPEFIAALGDLYALSGPKAEAEAQYGLVRAIAHLASIQAQVYNRQLVLFEANHGESVTNALALAQREIAVRKDVYGWDALAWALYADGRYADAATAMRTARALGTVDPLLDYHQGMIDAALGLTVPARELLNAALERNPGFDPLQAARARSILAGLGNGNSR